MSHRSLCQLSHRFMSVLWCGQRRCLHKNKGLGRFVFICGAPDPNSASSHRPSADRGVKGVRGGGFNF